MENQNPPLDRRTQTLVELHELIDQLAAAALGVPVTDSSGRPLKPDTYQFAAILDVGHARYKAVYILDADSKRYAEGQAWLAERRAAVES